MMKDFEAGVVMVIVKSIDIYLFIYLKQIKNKSQNGQENTRVQGNSLGTQEVQQIHDIQASKEDWKTWDRRPVSERKFCANSEYVEPVFIFYNVS